MSRCRLSILYIQAVKPDYSCRRKELNSSHGKSDFDDGCNYHRNGRLPPGWTIPSGGPTHAISRNNTAGIHRHHPEWKTVGPHNIPSMLRELASLQERMAYQDEQLEQLQKELEERDAESEELKDALHLAQFKYELLVDLVSLAVVEGSFYILMVGCPTKVGAHHHC